jgi:hypothetical protein
VQVAVRGILAVLRQNFHPRQARIALALPQKWQFSQWFEFKAGAPVRAMR